MKAKIVEKFGDEVLKDDEYIGRSQQTNGRYHERYYDQSKGSLTKYHDAKLRAVEALSVYDTV